MYYLFYLHALLCICLYGLYIILTVLLLFIYLFLISPLFKKREVVRQSLLRNFAVCERFVAMIILARISPLLFDVAVAQRHQKS